MQQAVISRLDGASWLHSIARVFDRAGMELFVVGGAVRNPLMGLPLSDVDVCGPARPEAVCALCEGTAVQAFLRAAHFGTVELHVTDENGKRCMAEYTTFREDSYRCGHKPDAVRFTTELEVDALRRDFSVNALYRRVYADGLGPVIDPTGGQAHMRQGLLHTVTADPDQVLKDDGLRILRAARFQAELGLRPTPALMESLTRYAPLLKEIVPERLQVELHKVLLADERYPMLKRSVSGVEAGLETIYRIGAWPYLMPSLPCRADGIQAAGRLCRLQEKARRSALGQRLHRMGILPASLFCLGMALLAKQAAPGQLEQDMTSLRFSIAETREAVLLLNTLQAAQANKPDVFTAVRAGLAAHGEPCCCWMRWEIRMAKPGWKG